MKRERASYRDFGNFENPPLEGVVAATSALTVVKSYLFLVSDCLFF